MVDDEIFQPVPVSKEPAQQVSEQAATEIPTEPQTAQIPPNEPLSPEPEPAATPIPPPVAAPTLSSSFARDLLNKARATIQFRKTAKLEKIMTELNKRSKITNDEVEKLLHVSDATATRYLSELERQGKIKQVGKTGKAVTYAKP